MQRIFHFVGPEYKPNSVAHCCGTAIYLGGTLLHRSSGALPCGSTALHESKDLAVSPRKLLSGFTLRGKPRRVSLSFQTKTSLLAPRALRRTGVTRYRTPSVYTLGRVRTFLRASKKHGDRHIRSTKTVPQKHYLHNSLLG